MEKKREFVQIEHLNITEQKQYEKLIKQVIEACFEEEKLISTNLYISITLTNLEQIQEINKNYRKIDKATDVLSFPMFEKEELEHIIQNQPNEVEDVLGDIIICLPKVEEQAKEYGHSVQRELAYMLVHGFYHLMGYDHIEEEDKKKMRPKEEHILNQLQITREEK